MSRASSRVTRHASRQHWFKVWTYLITAIGLIFVVSALAACADENGNDQADSPIPTSTRQSAGSVTNGDEEPISVAVTMPFLPSMVEAVGGERVEVRSIVPPGTDAHTYQPSPSDARVIAGADLIIANGLGLEEFLDGLIDSAGGSQVLVTELAEGLHEHVDHDADDHEQGHDEHDHPDGNPHLWLSPEYGIHYVERIADALVDLDPANEDTYRANAESYVVEIEALDEWAREEVERIPEEKRKLVTFHDAFPYFAEHFGLEIVGVVIRSPGREPGAQELAEIVDEIREAGVPAVFIEPQFNPQLAETIANEAGVSTHLIYSDTPPEGAGYLEMMRMNVEHVVEGLG